MASARLVRNLISPEFGLPQLLQYVIRQRKFPSCLSCGRVNHFSRSYSSILTKSASFRASAKREPIAVRCESTKVSTKDAMENGDPAPSSSRSPPSRTNSSDRDAENDENYFKSIDEQPSVSRSIGGRVNWNKFVEPAPSSSRSPPGRTDSSDRDVSDYTIVDAENDANYFKSIGEQPSVSRSMGGRVNWNKFVDPAPSSSRSPPSRTNSSDRDVSDYTIVDAENDANYFKSIGEQPSVSRSMGGRVNWNKFVDPDRPSSEDLHRNQPAEDQFGRQTKENPFLYPRKTKTQVATVQDALEMDFEDIDWKELEKSDPENRPLERISDADASLVDVQPALQPFSHNLAAFANESDNIQKLVDMGVEVWKFDKDPEMSQRIMTAEWDSKIQPWIDWMKGLNLTDYDMKQVMGKHPRIFKESIKDLEKRVAYFESKRFVREVIGQIVVRAPQTFSWNVRYIDKRLGELQKQFKLTGAEVREVVAKQPKLIVLPGHQLDVVRMALLNEMGFTAAELKRMLMEKPKLFRQTKRSLLGRFDFLHNVCGFSHDLLARFPEALLTRKFRVRERHLFLKSTKKNQYDPAKPGYVSLPALVTGRDVEFCTDVAKVPVEVFNEFIKTL